MKGDADNPDSIDAAFAAIVKGLEREGVGSGLAKERPAKDASAKDDPDEERAPVTSTGPAPTGWRGHETQVDWDWNNDDEHYEPPEPPPIPRPSAMTVVALVLLVVGVFVLVAPAVIGLSSRIGTPVGLIALAAGIGMLLLRIKQRPPGPDDDDGAQV